MAWTSPVKWAATTTPVANATIWNWKPTGQSENPPFRISRMHGGPRKKNRCTFYDVEGEYGYYVSCRRKVYKKIPDLGPICKRHLWQWFQLQEEKVERARRAALDSSVGWKWYEKHKDEVKQVKEDDHWWFKKELLRELRGTD